MRLALLLLLVPLTASADPSIEMIDRGDTVEVVAHGMKAARTAITPVRSRLEIPLVGAPRLGADQRSPSDGTVKIIELNGGTLSVKLTHGREDVKALARFSQAIQVGEDLHVLIPRRLPPEGSGVVLPEPTLPPQLAAKLAATPAPIVAPSAPVAGPQKPEPAPLAGPRKGPPPEGSPIDPSSSGPVKAQPTPAPATAAPEAAKPAEPARLGKAPDDTAWSKITSYAAFGLALAGVGVWLMRRKRAQQQQQSSIEVVAQRALGPKSKVVWLSAGNREMIVAVTPQHVRMLGQWKKQDPASSSLPEATVEKAASSPAVAGILRLRQKTVPPEAIGMDVEASSRLRRYGSHAEPLVNEDVATGNLDEDSTWAKEILAATQRAGSRR